MNLSNFREIIFSEWWSYKRKHNFCCKIKLTCPTPIQNTKSTTQKLTYTNSNLNNSLFFATKKTHTTLTCTPILFPFPFPTL